MGKMPTLIDPDLLIQAGIDPKTGLPLKAKDGNQERPDLKHQIRKVLRIVDEQDAINRYNWYNLPSGLDGQLLERIMYYKGQGAFFYMEGNDTFYFLPYALDGNIDIYGRYLGITPLPFNGTSENEKDKAWIEGLVKTPVYEMPLETTPELFKDGCVLLSDFSKQRSQLNIPRQILNDPIVDAEAEAFPLARTSLIINSGVKGMRVADQDSQSQVEIASNNFYDAATSGKPYVAITSPIEMQDLSGTSALKAEEYLLYLQALDNFRLSLYGLKTGGLFQKKSHMLESEQDMNDGAVGFILQDGLTLRQKFCDIVNAIWGLGIYVEVSENATGIDKNMDGEIADNQDQTGIPGEQPQISEEVIDNE